MEEAEEVIVTPPPNENITSTGKVNIFHAAEENDEAAVKYFVEEKKVNLSETNYDEETSAHIAAKNGNLNIIKIMLDRDPTIVSTPDGEGETMLSLAIEKGHLQVVRSLVEEYKVNIDEKNIRISECTAIHIAAQYGHLPILKYLIGERKGNVNARNKLQETPAFYAAENKHHHIMKYLAEEAKADLTLVDFNEDNVLYMTIQKNDLILMKYLLDEAKVNLDINWRNKFGTTLVHHAAILNRVEFLKYLVEEKKADVNTPDNKDVPPLHSAAMRNYFDTCKYLIEHGADLNHTDYRNMTAIGYASTNNRLSQYMKEAIRKRSRRSVSEPLILFSTNNQSIAARIQIVNHQGSISAYRRESFSLHSLCYFQNLLHIAQMIVRISTNSLTRLNLWSPQKNVESKIDPIAVKAVQSIRHFPELTT